MEELLELKTLLLKGDIKGSLVIVEELEEMSKNDIIDNIYSLEVAEGIYDTEELEKLVNQEEIVNKALALISQIS